MNELGHRAAWRAAFGVALLAVAYALLAPRPPGADVASGIPLGDKLAHFGMFLVLGTLAVPAIGRRARVSFLVVVIYAALTEIAQIPLPDRQGDTLDFVADALGALAGVATAARVRWTRAIT